MNEKLYVVSLPSSFILPFLLGYTIYFQIKARIWDHLISDPLDSLAVSLILFPGSRSCKTCKHQHQTAAVHQSS